MASTLGSSLCRRGRCLYYLTLLVGGAGIVVWWISSYPPQDPQRLQWSDITFEAFVLLFFVACLVAWLHGMPDPKPTSIPVALTVLGIGGVANVTDEFRVLPRLLEDLDQFIQLVGFVVLSVGIYFDRREKIRLLDENRRMAERASSSESRYRALLDNSLVGIYVIENGKFTYVNEQFCRIFGYSKQEIEGKLGPSDLTAPESLDRVRTELAKRVRGEKESSHYAFKAMRKDGRLIDVEVYGARLEHSGRILIHGIVTDITERVRAEQEKRFLESQLFQAQKMEAIGALASGIAHDFNNILSGILGNVAILKMEGALPAHIRDGLEAIEKAGRKAAALTRQLLTLAKGKIQKREPVAPNDAVREVVELVRRTFPENIRVVMELDDRVPLVRGNRTQIEQCVLNLCINARDAMPRGGQLSLRTAKLEREDIGKLAMFVPETRHYVEICVEDTGVGMDEETRRRIFEPFFSRKGDLGGTGLGLAMVYNIVRGHAGWIQVESEPGRGSKFRIVLPGLDQVDWNPKEPETRDERIVRGAGRILVVDDEDMVREVTARILKGAGYEVEVAGSGEEALNILSRLNGQTDLVILDMVMPGMDGQAVLERIREDHPQLPVIVVTGYAIENKIQHLLGSGASAFVYKPLDAAKLTQVVGRVLGRGEAQEELM